MQEVTHPHGDVVPIVGIFADDCSHSCIEHTCCEEQVQLNVLLCVCKEQMKDGIDQCHVGFLRHSFTKCDKYNGALIQVVDVISPDDLMPSGEQNFIAFVSWLMQL